MRDRLGRSSLRIRVTALATVVALIVLVVAGWLLVAALGAAVRDEITAGAAVRGRDLAALAADGALPDPVTVGDSDEALVQVVADAEVVGGSANARSLAPLDVAPPPRDGTAVVRRAELPGLEVEQDGGGYVVVATTVEVDGRLTTVYVASSLEDAAESAAAAAQVGLLALPVLVGLLGAGVWVLVGRTLAPVDAIRTEADAIGGGDLHRRVPEPVAQDEVGRLARTLNRMLERLEESAERERRFVGDAAHELRTPIASIRTNLETARASARPVDWDTVTGEALAATVRMQRLTEQLLLLARSDAGRLAGRMRAVDLDEVVTELVAGRPAHREIAVTASVTPVQVVGDRLLLEQTVGELVGNAVAHAATRVEVSCGPDRAGAVVTVDDDGPGIPAERRDEVFERFARIDGARTRARGGAGLGLAIVADIVAIHHGSVTIDEAVDGGARVTLTLPRGDHR